MTRSTGGASADGVDAGDPAGPEGRGVTRRFPPPPGASRAELLAAVEPRVSTRRLVVWGNVAWLVALVVLLAVPRLHTGSRAWWPWVAVSGFVLGLIGWAYLRRGRGNAADAD